MWGLQSVLHQSIFQCCRGPFAIWSDWWPFASSLIFCLDLQTQCCFCSSHLSFPASLSSLRIISYNFLKCFFLSWTCPPCSPLNPIPLYFLSPMVLLWRWLFFCRHETSLSSVPVFFLLLPPIKQHMRHYWIMWYMWYAVTCIIWLSALWRSSHLPPGSQSAPGKGSMCKSVWSYSAAPAPFSFLANSL